MSAELKILTSLYTRDSLSITDKQSYFNKLKGYEGELEFDVWLENLEIECLIVNDLLLEVNSTLFQIDSLIIFQETLHLFEVKNIEGDYFYEGKRLKTIAGTEIKDPLLQVSRSESLLRQLLRNLGSNINVEAHLVFINPEFALYQAPLEQSIILPNQLNRTMKKLNKTKSKLTNKHTNLAEKFISLHQTTSPYTRLPVYEYEGLHKGIICNNCGTVIEEHQGRSVICPQCEARESDESAIMRSVEEFKLLFPERRITSNGISEWSNHLFSKKTIRRILRKNLNMVGNSKMCYYK